MLGEALAVTCSIITGLLVIYALIIMIAPELYRSIRTIWISLPDRAEQISNWVARTLGGNETLATYFHTTYQTVYNELDVWASENLVPYVTDIVSGVGMSVWKVLVFL